MFPKKVWISWQKYTLFYSLATSSGCLRKKFVLIKEICKRTEIRPICSTNPRIEIVSAVFSVVIVSYSSNLGLCRGFYSKIWSAGPTLAPLYTSTYIGLRSNLKKEKKNKTLMLNIIHD